MRGTRREFLQGTAGLAFLGLPGPGLTVDFSSPAGTIKALHGVVNGPYDCDGMANVSIHHKRAAFPLLHLNAVHWPTTDVFDHHCVFPLFHADENDPKNYVFSRSDTSMTAAIETGAQVVYRLGESIEHGTSWHVKPPPDFEKWARICVNIIRHYNEGWAGGFRHGIRHWQIWNEPENNEQWHGSLEQYLRLYEVAARAIKAHDPALHVGGPAATRVDSRLVLPFLEHCRDRKVPLDFFSWHRYTDSPKIVLQDAIKARKLLDEHGFARAENQLSEYHYLKYPWGEIHTPDPAAFAAVRERFGHMNGPEGAAFTASVLLLLQDAPVDMACHYTADTIRYGLFDEFGMPRKIYYPLLALNEMMKTPHRVACEGLPMDDTVAGVAGVSDDGRSAALLVSRFKSPASALPIAFKNLPWKGGTRAEIFRIDAEHDLSKTGEEILDPGSVLTLSLPAPSVALVRLGPA